MHPNKRAHGFSLVEVMVALAILAVLATAYTATSIYARKSAETNVMESTALTVAAGYLEQIKSLEYESLIVCVKDPSEPLQTMVNQGKADPIYLGKFTTKTVIMNEDAYGKPIQTMDVSVRPDISDLSATTGERILNIRITYRWQQIDTGQTQERILRTSRSYVPTF